MMNEEGSAQGNIISPILANIYMHNVLTLWYKFIITKECKGDNFLIVYADDFVAGFQYKWEAENYYKLLKERMEKFGLQLEESKSRLLQSGAYIARAKQKSGESTRLETFDFLGFTFYCGRSRKGMPYIMPKTDQDKRITQLETRVNAMEGFLKNDKQRLDRMDEGQHVTMQALLALLDHNLDGNNIDQMQQAKKALQKHLIG